MAHRSEKLFWGHLGGPLGQLKVVGAGEETHFWGHFKSDFWVMHYWPSSCLGAQSLDCALPKARQSGNHFENSWSDTGACFGNTWSGRKLSQA